MVRLLTVPRGVGHPHGCFKLNFDGSVVSNLRPTGVGGLIRDSAGPTLLSFLGLVGLYSVNRVEMELLQIDLCET